MRQYKCVSCKELISDKDLYEAPKLNKNGDVLCYKSGKQMTKKYHLMCFNKLNDWCDLIKYIENRYFKVVLPKEIIIQLRILGKKTSYKNIFDCLNNIENELINYIESHEFNDDVHKCNYILFQLKRNINTFVDKKYDEEISKKIEQIEIIEPIQFLDRSKINIDIDNINYDILD
jgi:hypothetical protein